MTSDLSMKMRSLRSPRAGKVEGCQLGGFRTKDRNPAEKNLPAEEPASPSLFEPLPPFRAISEKQLPLAVG